MTASARLSPRFANSSTPPTRWASHTCGRNPPPTFWLASPASPYARSRSTTASRLCREPLVRDTSAILDDGLRVELNDDERLEVARGPTVDGEAYDLYLQARYLQRRATENDYLEAIELLERAIVRDPRYAQAYLLLSAIHTALGIDGFTRPADARVQASRYERRALEFDPDLPDARAIKHGLAFFYDWDWEGAERERTLAMQSPVGDFDPDLLRTYSLELLARGRTEEALDLARRSRELDPLSVGLSMLEADYLVHAGQLVTAVDVYNRTIEVDPKNHDAYFGLAEALLRQRRFDEASEARRQAHRPLGRFGGGRAVRCGQW